MERWNKKNIPHKGWTCLGMEDYETDYQKCDMCGKEDIRYVHLMQHGKVETLFRVGCVCAAKMEDNYSGARKREDNFKNRAKRKANYLKRQWEQSCMNELIFYLRYKGKVVSLIKSKYHKNAYGIAYNNNIWWKAKSGPIDSFERAKELAFEIFDRPEY